MTRPLSVLHVHSGNLFGGIERVLAALHRCEGADDVQHRFALAFDGRLRRDLGGAVAGVLGGVRRRYPWSVHFARRRLRAMLDTARPDLAMLHAPWAQDVFGPALADAGLPIIRWFHGAPAPDDAWERRAQATRPARVVCNSDFTRAAAAPFIAGIATDMLYPPVEPPLGLGTEARARLRAVHDVSPEAVVVLHVARVEPGKGQRELIEAAARLDRALPWQVWLLGAPQRPEERAYFTSLEQAVARHHLGDRVRLLGEHPEVGGFLAAADLYCQPNVAPDAFGVSFVEALYAALPVVTTALGGAVEIVSEACGILVPAGDGPALVDALTQLIRDDRRRSLLGLEGPACAARLCDPRRQHGRLATILREAAR